MSEIDVVTQALRQEAGTWDAQSEAIGQVAAAAEGQRMSGLQAGIFFVMRDAYDGAVTQVASRCQEGKSRMAEIATALRANADAYDRRDEEVSEHVEGAY